MGVGSSGPTCYDVHGVTNNIRKDEAHHLQKEMPMDYRGRQRQVTAQKPWHKYCSELHLCHPHVKADGNGADLGPFLFYSPMSVTLSFLNLQIYNVLDAGPSRWKM